MASSKKIGSDPNHETVKGCRRPRNSSRHERKNGFQSGKVGAEPEKVDTEPGKAAANQISSRNQDALVPRKVATYSEKVGAEPSLQQEKLPLSQEKSTPTHGKLLPM